jgi:hypothetical protein
MRPLLLAAALLAAFSHWASAQEPDNVIQARHLLADAASLIKDIPEIQQESAAANVAGQLTRAGDLARSLEVVHQLKPDKQGLPMGCVAWQIANTGNAEEAIALIQGTSQSQGKDVAFEQVAQVLARKGEVQQALRAAHFIEEPNRQVDALVRVAIQQGKSGDLPGASRTLDEALKAAEQVARKDLSHAGIFSQIAGAQAEIGDVPEVGLALMRLSYFADKQKAQTGETSLMGELAMAEALRGNTNQALELISHLPASAANPLYMILSETEARRGSMGDALAFVEKISESGSRDVGLRGIAMARRNQDLGDSYEAIAKMHDLSNQNEALATLGFEQAEDNDPRAYQTLQRWNDSRGNHLANYEQSAGTAAVTYGLLGDFVSAERILRSMRDPEKRSWTLWNLTSFLVSKRRTQEAQDLAQSEEDALPRFYALLGTAGGLLDRAEAEAKAAHEQE